jgi:hypothetical protein
MGSRMCLVGANAARPALSADAISSSVRVNRAGADWRISTGRRRPVTGTHAVGNPRANGACGSGHASDTVRIGLSLSGWPRNPRRWPRETQGAVLGSAGDHGDVRAQRNHHRTLQLGRQHFRSGETVQHAVEHISRMDAAIENSSATDAIQWRVGHAAGSAP